MGTLQIRSVAFSPDGLCLASGNSDRTVRLWDLRMNACIDILHFAQEVHSVTYSSSGQLGIAVGNSIQCWVPAATPVLLSQEGARLQLLWRTDTSTVLQATACDLTDATGLTDSDIVLLTEQLGAIGKPASAPIMERRRSSQTFFQPSAALAISSCVSATSLSQSTTAATTSTTTTTTRVTTPLTSSTASASSGSAHPQKSSAAYLISRFKAWTSKQTERKPSPAPPSMTKKR